ncbi:MAG: hypothetical protein H0X46_09685, partial [Bacteroidetes bacterium]|nr:hypothetical protein [Bacteroidota bacterium]
MCGIAGIIAFNEKGREHLSEISAATYCLIKRGPDGEGLFFAKNVALGHRRLSIIDTTNAGSQPFTDETKRYTIVFNGEIFNYKTLRLELEQKGVTFRSHSDTEVLLQLYISYKEKCLEQLDGEFAFAIYDSASKELFIARDRYGIKPIYYFKDGDRFVFASEMKALMSFNIPKKIDKASLQLYFHLNYIPSPSSIFENVKKVEAGTWLKINAEGKVENKTYYSIPYQEKLNAPKDYFSAKKQLRSLLESSVESR